MGVTAEKTHHEIEMHRQVAHMYRRRSQWAFARDFQDERNEVLMSLAPPGRDHPAVDLGCGTGITLDLLLARYDQVAGLDVSQEMLEGFDRSAVESGLVLTRGDMARLPFASDAFDVVVCRSALHHMDDEHGVLSEICRVLTPEGTLILGEPSNDNPITRLARWWAKRGKGYGTIHTIDRAYTRGQLTKLLHAAGLEVVKEVRFGFVAYPLCDNPELVPVLRWLPGSRFLGAALRAVDRLLAAIPVIRSLSWYTMLQVRRRAR
jgi:ubiquinone/menaquinone biosynthesis C-methylase UbiE